MKNGSGIGYIGGILGGWTNITINNCYNIGNISIEKTGANAPYIGGVAGGGTGNASRCYNIGEVNCKAPERTPMVGGCLGTGINADYCCNIGAVIYEAKSASCIGTLVGWIEGTVSNSYTLTNAELNGIGNNVSKTPEPTKVDTVAEMPTVLEIVGSGFKEDTNNINNGYPILSWQ